MHTDEFVRCPSHALVLFRFSCKSRVLLSRFSLASLLFLSRAEVRLELPHVNALTKVCCTRGTSDHRRRIKPS